MWEMPVAAGFAGLVRALLGWFAVMPEQEKLDGKRLLMTVLGSACIGTLSVFAGMPEDVAAVMMTGWIGTEAVQRVWKFIKGFAGKKE